MTIELERHLKPSGYRMLLKPLPVEEVTSGGIVLPSQTQSNERILGQIGQVVAMGPQCFDHIKFNNTRYCKVGDYVLHGQYTGITVTASNGGAYKIINDDEVLAVVDDPEAIQRAR